MRRRLLIAIAAGLILALLACGLEEPEESALGRIARSYPSVDGSTSTYPLGVLLACQILGVPYEWRTPPAAERTVFPDRREHPLLAAQIEREIQHHGTHQAYVNLIEGKADLILVAREPSEPEREAAESAGVKLSVQPIALDALVFVVNVDNPLDSLSLDQVRAIFGAPGVKSWADVGGSNTSLEAFQRQQDSGSQELMQRLVMKDQPMVSQETAPLIFTMGGVVSTMAARDRGISFSVYYYVTNMAPNPATKMLAIDNVHPTGDSIGSRQYPLTSEVCVVIREGYPAESPARLLRDWLLTAEGKLAIRESGYAPTP